MAPVFGGQWARGLLSLTRVVGGIAAIAGLACMPFHRAIASAPADTYEAVRLDGPEARGLLWLKQPRASARGVVVVLPGSQMTGDRYTWLADHLAARGFAVVLVEASLEWEKSRNGDGSVVPARNATMPHALAALAEARRRWPEAARTQLTLIGHSLGGGVLLDMLDPAEALRSGRTGAAPGFRGVTGIHSAVVLGASLQASLGWVTLAGRSDSGALQRPAGTRLLLIAGEHDRMASPALMRLTASRYRVPPVLKVIDGANHLGWSTGRGAMDRPDLDGRATIPIDEQIRRTLIEIDRFLAAP